MIVSSTVLIIVKKVANGGAYLFLYCNLWVTHVQALNVDRRNQIEPSSKRKLRGKKMAITALMKNHPPN